VKEEMTSTIGGLYQQTEKSAVGSEHCCLPTGWRSYDNTVDKNSMRNIRKGHVTHLQLFDYTDGRKIYHLKFEKVT